MIRIKAVTVFIPSSVKLQKGGVADKVKLCAGSQVAGLLIFFFFFFNS